MISSGLRIGSPALATRGLQADDFAELGQIVATALTPAFGERRAELTERVAQIVERYPLYEHLGAGALA
jgi:glycine hydroxymethyltransferase